MIKQKIKILNFVYFIKIVGVRSAKKLFVFTFLYYGTTLKVTATSAQSCLLIFSSPSGGINPKSDQRFAK